MFDAFEPETSTDRRSRVAVMTVVSLLVWAGAAGGLMWAGANAAAEDDEAELEVRLAAAPPPPHTRAPRALRRAFPPATRSPSALPFPASAAMAPPPLPPPPRGSGAS